MAAEAARSAEAQTQPAALDTAVEAETAKMAGHCVKRLAVAASEDRVGKGDRSRSMTEKTVFEGKTPGNGSDDPMDQTVRSEQHQNVDLLQQMKLLCQKVQNLGKQIQESDSNILIQKSQRRQDDYR